MRTLWRISNHLDLAGWGGEKFASRWAPKGCRIVYLAESPSAALLEVLVHLKDRDGDLPGSYNLIEVSAPKELAVTEIPAPQAEDWRQEQSQTRQLGNGWLESRQSALARVPSAILPRTWNLLLNPLHPDAGRLRIAEAIREKFDPRLFRLGGR